MGNLHDDEILTDIPDVGQTIKFWDDPHPVEILEIRLNEDLNEQEFRHVCPYTSDMVWSLFHAVESVT